MGKTNGEKHHLKPSKWCHWLSPRGSGEDLSATKQPPDEIVGLGGSRSNQMRSAAAGHQGITWSQRERDRSCTSYTRVPASLFALPNHTAWHNKSYYLLVQISLYFLCSQER